jgi:transcriptional regulator with XRE-family HTH domain
MDWGASRILALRKHAEMTQAQFAQWLGVSIKQVKYLEHQRRNPSGPTRRLLDILAVQFHFNGTETTDAMRLRPPARKLQRQPPASAQPHEDGNEAAKPPETAPSPLTETTDPRVTATPIISGDDAFVWR